MLFIPLPEAIAAPAAAPTRPAAAGPASPVDDSLRFFCFLDPHLHHHFPVPDEASETSESVLLRFGRAPKASAESTLSSSPASDSQPSSSIESEDEWCVCRSSRGRLCLRGYEPAASFTAITSTLRSFPSLPLRESFAARAARPAPRPKIAASVALSSFSRSRFFAAADLLC